MITLKSYFFNLRIYLQSSLEKSGYFSFGSVLGGKLSTYISIVKRPIGSIDPLTVTLSIYLTYSAKALLNCSYKLLEIRSGTPYCLVAASNLAAMLTLGLK